MWTTRVVMWVSMDENAIAINPTKINVIDLPLDLSASTFKATVQHKWMHDALVMEYADLAGVSGGDGRGGGTVA